MLWLLLGALLGIGLGLVILFVLVSIYAWWTGRDADAAIDAYMELTKRQHAEWEAERERLADTPEVMLDAWWVMHERHLQERVVPQLVMETLTGLEPLSGGPE